MSNELRDPLLNVLGEDSDLTPYRKSLRNLTKTVNAAIILTQILYWRNKSKGKPFYKYKQPIEPQREEESDEEFSKRAAYYREGDSWCEELGLTKREFENAIEKIAHRRGEEDKINAEIYPVKPFIEYWTTLDRRTFYFIENPEGLTKIIKEAFQKKYFMKSIKGDLRTSPKVTDNNREYNTEITTDSLLLTKVNKQTTTPFEATPLKGVSLLKREMLSKPTNGRMDFIPSDKASAILSYWNDKNLVQHREGTKRYKSTCLLIDRIASGNYNHPLFKDRKFKRADFIRAIDNFALAALDDTYEPSDPTHKLYFRRLGLQDFLINTRTGKSMFLCFLEKKPVLAGTIKKSELTPVVSLLSDWYAANDEKKGDKDFTRKEWKDFYTAEEKLKEFLAENRKFLLLDTITHLGGLEGASDELSALAVYLIGSVEDAWKSSDLVLTTGWFSSDNAFQKRLPEFLRKKGVMRK